jgi:FixJ family two-component response regulator
MSSQVISHGYAMDSAQAFGRGLGLSWVSRAKPIAFVVDGDDFERESLELLARHEDWQPETFPSIEEFLAHPRAIVPNCLVLDVSPPRFTGLEFQKRLAIDRPDMAIIFITGHAHVPTAVQAMKAGAIEFFTKPFQEHELLRAMHAAMEQSCIALSQGAEMQILRDAYASLTPREQQVMALVASGLLNKQVAGELRISEITVKGHRGQVMQKMKANSLAHLVRMASRLKLDA